MSATSCSTTVRTEHSESTMTAPEDLQRAIVGAVPELTGEQVADSAGLSVDEARRLWRALGFPEVGEAAAFTTVDAEALAKVADIVNSADLDFDTIVRMTRAVGQTMDRLAEWEVATLAALLDRSGTGAPARIRTGVHFRTRSRSTGAG